MSKSHAYRARSVATKKRSRAAACPQACRSCAWPDVQPLESRMMLSFSPLHTNPALNAGPAVSVIDTNLEGAHYGDVYVATAAPEGSNGEAFSVSRYTSSGSLDKTWGSSGTLTLNNFSSQSNDADIPYGIAISGDGSMVAIVGQSNVIGWAVAVVSTASGGSLAWQDTNTLVTGRATCVMFDSSESDVIVAGTDNTHMVVAQLSDSDGSPDSYFGSNGIDTLPTTGDSSAANAILETQDRNSSDDFIVVGTTTYTSGGTTASDFTLVRLSDTGQMDSTFGNNGEYGTERNNFAYCNPNACTAASTDVAYSVLEWEAPNQTDWYLYVVGTTNADGQNQFAIARYNEDVLRDQNGNITAQAGRLDTTWGFRNGNGVQTGELISRAGIAYSAALSGGTYGSGKLVAAGEDPQENFAIHAYNTDGSDDTSFGTNGDIDSDFGSSGTSAINSVNFETDGSLQISGVYTNACGASDVGLADYSFA